MMHKVFVTVVCFLVLSTNVTASATPFGRININYNHSDGNGDELNRFNGWGSRFGIKGATYLGDEVERNYIIEVEWPVFEDENEIDFRQAWFGLRSDWGEIRFGRHLGPSEVALDPIDLFSFQAADQNTILESEVRHEKSVAYINHFNGIGYALSLSPSDENNRITIDMLVNYNTEHLYLAAAYLHEGSQRDTIRFGATYRFPDGHHLGAALETLDDKQGRSGHDAYLLNAAYQLGKTLFKLQLGANEPDKGGHTEKLLALGVDYEIWEATTLKAQYSVNTHRDHNADDEERVFALGVTWLY